MRSVEIAECAVSYSFNSTLAAGEGLEPSLTGPKPVVLPLDDPAMFIA